MTFNQSQFNDFIISSGAVGFFNEPIKLSSGRMSNWYVNLRKISYDVFLLDKMADFVIEFVSDLQLKQDCFYGVPEGATKLGIIAQFKFAKMQANYGAGKYCLPMGRGKLKEHGAPEDRVFEGKPRGRTIVIEDVTTTGDSLLRVIDQLRTEKVEIIAAIGVVNRNEKRDDGKTVAQAVQEKGLNYYQMANAVELLPLAFRKLQPGEEAARLVENYFATYGAEKINLA